MAPNRRQTLSRPDVRFGSKADIFGWPQQCPVYPQKRTLLNDSWMSALCQKQTYLWKSAPLQYPSSISLIEVKDGPNAVAAKRTVAAG